MIKLISGLPGAGKGVYTVMKLEDELASTDRHIFTNFAIKLHPWVRRMSRRRSRGEKGFLAHLHDKYGKTFDADKRIHILDDEQMRYFYLHRVDHDGKPIELEVVRDKRTAKAISFDTDAFMRTQPCVYIMDEGGSFFNARDWQTTEGAFGHYQRQHRKAGDDFWVTCQHSSQMDKQVRTMVQEFHTLVNHGMRKMLMFKQPDRISVVVSNDPPELRSKSLSVPKFMKFDKQGIGGSFDTAAGAGVQGNAADIERKKSGLPAWGIPALVILVGLGLIAAAKGAGWVTGGLLTGHFNKTVATLPPIGKQPQLASDPTGLKTALTPKQSLRSDHQELNAGQQEPKDEPVTMTGLFMSLPKKTVVNGVEFVQPAPLSAILSNGEVYTMGDGHCTLVNKYGCIVDGVGYLFKQPKPTKPERQYLWQRPLTESYGSRRSPF